MTPSRLPVALAAALLLVVPTASATTDTFGDASGDGGSLGPAYDILQWTVESNGATLTSTYEVADLAAGDSVEYNWHFRNAAGDEFRAGCVIGAGIPVHAPSGCSASLTDTSLLNLVAISHAIPVTLAVDLAADTVSIGFDYSDIASSSGDSVTVILGSSAHPSGAYYPGVVGDHILVQSPVTLA